MTMSDDPPGSKLERAQATLPGAVLQFQSIADTAVRATPDGSVSVTCTLLPRPGPSLAMLSV